MTGDEAKGRCWTLLQQRSCYWVLQTNARNEEEVAILLKKSNWSYISMHLDILNSQWEQAGEQFQFLSTPFILRLDSNDKKFM